MGEACDCCEGLHGETPRALDNPPGLPALAYRVGRHAQFRASMLAGLSATGSMALARLTARDDGDLTVALCDATASVLDVLSFYQERIANEHYLGTAREPLSLQALARLIGHRPAPGVAASTYLAFALQDTPGSAFTTIIPDGTQVQSVPGPDELPCTFETSDTIEARASWNAIPVQTSSAWSPQRGDRDLFLRGVATQLAPGDAILIVGEERALDVGSDRWDVRILTQVEPDLSKGHTRVSWLDGLGSKVPSVLPASNTPRVYALRQRAALFGHNAPDPNLLFKEPNALTEGTIGHLTWSNYAISPPDVELDAAYPKLVADGWLALVSNEGGFGTASLPGYVELYRIARVSIESIAKFGLSGRLTRITCDGKPPENLSAARFGIRSTLALTQSEELSVAPRPLTLPVFGTTITLVGNQGDLKAGRTLALRGKLPRVAIAEGREDLLLAFDDGTSRSLAPRESLQLVAPPAALNGTAVESLTLDRFALRYGTTERLRWRVRDRDGREGELDAAGDALLLRAAEGKDETVQEIVTLASAETAVQVARDGTVVTLSAGVRYPYDRDSLRVCANVVHATQGESVRETLGSGMASAPDQRFLLRQSPVTQVSASTASGRASTLTVRVNELAWTEVDALYGRGPSERVFATRQDEVGRTTVVFGDGVEGARPATGRDNIRARYRKGLGAAGNVTAGKLSTLLSRPLGVSGVTNPEPARGGQDAEGLEATREAVSRSVLTLGRAVSVRDYQNYARAFAGIAKAHAAWIAAGPGRGVFLTVAAEGGAALSPTSDTYRDLLASLRSYGDALLPLQLASYRAVLFRLRVAIVVTPEAEPARVLAQARQKLGEAFSFAARRFGQPVSVDEVAAVLHQQGGVLAVNLLQLHRSDATAALEPRLFARLPETSLTQAPKPAELLVLDAERLLVEVMS